MANYELNTRDTLQMAQEFLGEHDISHEEFTSTYISERDRQIKEGEPTWVVRGVEREGRAYDLHYKGEVLATMADGIGDFHLGSIFLYFCDKDADPAKEGIKQAAYDKLEAIRLEYGAGPERKLRQIATAIESVDQYLGNLDKIGD